MQLAAQVRDLVRHTQRALAEAAPADAGAASARAEPLVRHGEAMRERVAELKQFMFRSLYRHPQVQQTTAKAREVVTDLFAAYCADPMQVPADYPSAAESERRVADYIAGMTDRFALREHQRLTGRSLFAALG